MEAGKPTYAARLDIEYPQFVDRLSTALRIFYIIPIAIVIALLSGGNYRYGISGVGVLFPAVLLMILFRQKYPRWWFDWNLNLTRFSVRVLSYMLLLRHEYPSTTDEQSVHVELDYPEDVPQQLNRWLPLVKWFLAIPHYFVLFFLGLAVLVLTIIAWFSILFTGRYPDSFFSFVVGVQRWWLRVSAYAILLLTDEYPPFSLD